MSEDLFRQNFNCGDKFRFRFMSNFAEAGSFLLTVKMFNFNFCFAKQNGKNVYQSINHFKLQHKRVFFYQLIDSVTLMQRIANIFLQLNDIFYQPQYLSRWWRYQWMKPYSLDPVSLLDCPHHYQATSCSAAGGGPLPYHDNFHKPGDLGPSNNDMLRF